MEELNNQKLSLENIKKQLTENFKNEESILNQILQKEKDIETKIAQAEESEKNAKSVQERKVFSQKLFNLSKERREIEKEKWNQYEKIKKVKALIEENNLKIQELLKEIEKNNLQIKDLDNKLKEIDLQNQKDILKENLEKSQKDLTEIQSLITTYLKKHAEIEEKLSQIAQREKEVEKEREEIEKKEKTTLSLEEQRKIEETRWQIDSKLEEIEKEKWPLEEELNKIEGQIAKLEEKKIEFENSIKNILSQIEEIDIYLQYGIEKGKEIIESKKTQISKYPRPEPLEEEKKEEIGKEEKEEKKVITIKEIPIEKKIEEKILEAEKLKLQKELEKEKEKIEEEKRKTLEEKKMLEEQRRKIEFERRRLEELKKLAQEKEIKVKENIMSPKERFLEMVTKISPEEEAKRKEFAAKITGKKIFQEGPIDEKEAVFLKPVVVQKQPKTEKIVIRFLILLVLIGVGVGIYLLYNTYIFPWQKRKTLPPVLNPIETSTQTISTSSENLQATSSQENINETETTSTTPLSETTSSLETSTLPEIQYLFSFPVEDTKIIQATNTADILNEFSNIILNVKQSTSSDLWIRVIFLNPESKEVFNFIKTLNLFSAKEINNIFSEEDFLQSEIFLRKSPKLLSAIIISEIKNKDNVLNSIASWEKLMPSDLSLLFEKIYGKKIKFIGSFQISQKPYNFKYLNSNQSYIGICYTIFSPDGNKFYFVISTSGESIIDFLRKVINQ